MSPLSPAILAVLELFRGPLASVRFADVDAEGLAALASDVERAAIEVESQETKLVELRQHLAQAQESLLVLAQRALAYARVYAESNDELSEELNRISLPRAQKPQKPQKPRKSAAAPEGSTSAASAEQLESTPEGASVEADAQHLNEPMRESEVELDADSAEAAPSPSPGTGERKGKRKGPLRAAREANAAASE